MRTLWLRPLVIISSVLLAGSDAGATHPNIQRDYRFISRDSTLTRSNTIGGGELKLYVLGTFDLSPRLPSD
jgi:hypothetical protein